LQDLSLHILDIVENSLKAGASRVEIRVGEDLERDRMTIEIVDNGCGMDEAMMARVLDPFFTTRKTRRVGLGLPFLKEACRESRGELSLRSQPGKGTTVMATFQHSHIDRKPMGDIRETLIALIAGHPEVEILYEHRKNGASFVLDTREIQEGLGGVPLNAPQVLSALREHIRSGLQDLAG
jgi:anti-sigma regulatory factor (Ser/Thr protein kinase)